ncbi:MAG: RimK family alpha-L-glutamate ligase [Syntrophobacteraceae bacterium]
MQCETSADSVAIALGKRLRSSAVIASVGVNPEWEHYSPETQEAIRRASVVFYPSSLYEPVLRSLGKQTYPRNYYRFMGNKIRQTELFQLLGISHPRTRLFYGRNRLRRITSEFDYPFIAKKPMGSSKGLGVFLIRNATDAGEYLEGHRPAYVQEYLPIDRDLRVIVLGGRVIHAYWRIRRPGEFRCNVAQGAEISFEGIPEDGLVFAKDVARRCGFEEVGMDICIAHGHHYILEANMVFGLEGVRQAGIDIYEAITRAAEEGLVKA